MFILSGTQAFTEKKKEPSRTSGLPERPWQRFVADLFESEERHYLWLLGDFRYFEEAPLTSTTSVDVIEEIWGVFANWGTPE